jgi:APA family basic amino acid/polyamine antiporter
LTQPRQHQLKRLLGKSFSIAACVGTIIGLGILRTPGEIARVVQDPWLYMALWTGGGAFVLLSTMVVAELIALTPRSGGPYALIANAFGPYPGFLLGWTDWLGNCAAAALKAVVLMEYAALLVPELRPFIIVGALLINGAFALLQMGGVRLGGRIFQVAAAVFVLILLSVSVSLLFGNPEPLPTSQVASNIIHTAPTWAHYGIVVAAIVFTYDGWVGASYYSGEVVGGARSAAIGSIKGVLIVIALYLLLNGLLAVNVPLAVLDGQELALAGALDYLYGAGAGTFIILAALVILLAHQNVQYMGASRALYALSMDGLGSRRATGVSQRGTPTGAVLTSWGLMALLILAGGFEFLLNMATLLFIAGYVAMVLGVFRMRRKAPGLERPYRAWGFPLTGVFCGVGWIAIAAFVGLMDLQSAAYSLALTALSVPLFLLLRSRRRGAVHVGP